MGWEGRIASMVVRVAVSGPYSFPNCVSGTTRIRGFRCEVFEIAGGRSQQYATFSTRRSVRAKALFALAPEVASGDHATQQRNGGVVRIAELAIQRIKNRDRGVEAHEVE